LLGEARVHKSIEFSSWNIVIPNLGLNSITFGNLKKSQRSALFTYSGNWMRDWSQFFVPMPLDILAKTPRDIPPLSSHTIGNVGAQNLVMSILQAIATLQLGVPVGNMVTPNNLKQYKPEHHVDNVAGYSWGDVVTMVNGVYVNGNTPNFIERNSQFPARAFKKLLQIENSTLSEVGPLGLSFHIYNSAEFAKQEFMKSIKSTDHQKAFMHFGSGLHVIEDYFAHSNFIEVALNHALQKQTGFNIPPNLQQLNPLPGSNKKNIFYVDTMYKKTPTAQYVKGWSSNVPNQSITTGTVGLEDTKVSLAHEILNGIQGVFQVIDNKIDEFFDLKKNPKTSSLKTFLSNQGKIRTSTALGIIIDGIDNAGLEFKTPNLVNKRLGDLTSSTVIRGALKAARNIPPRGLCVGFIKLPTITKGLSYKKSSVLLKQLEEAYGVIQHAYDCVNRTVNVISIPFKILSNIKKFVLNYINKIIQKIKDEIKRMLIRAVISFLEKMFGINLNSLKNVITKNIKNFVRIIYRLLKQVLVKHMNMWSGRSSLQSRLKQNKFRQRILQQPNSMPTYSNVSELPPSHSEISKDHPSGHRSLFYELHYKLAVDAVRYITFLMHQVWRGTQTRIVRNISSTTKGIDVNMFENLAVQEYDKKILEAKHLAKLGLKRTIKGSQNTTPISKLLRAVDLFLSHPESSTWWHPTMQNYLNNPSNARILLQDIKQRNKTRANRP